MRPVSGEPRRRFSTRRKALLGLLGIALAVVAWLAYTNAAGISGMPTQDMDWDADGKATRQEMLQAFYGVSVRKTREGQRECSAYFWRSDQRAIRVDCRTTMAQPDQK